MENYIVAATKPWHSEAFRRRAAALPGHWHFIDERDALTPEHLTTINPHRIFFPHWSWRVPDDVLDNWECVCFHMTDVPYGRGGSPLQNLIQQGHHETKLTALRMVRELDAGPVYLKRPLSLEGRAQDIFERVADLVYDMIPEILAGLEPEPQVGEPVIFPRRRPIQSMLPTGGDARALFDHIRMLDAETYPKAFLDHGDWRLEFSHAIADGDAVTATVTVMKRKTPRDHAE